MSKFDATTFDILNAALQLSRIRKIRKQITEKEMKKEDKLRNEYFKKREK